MGLIWGTDGRLLEAENSGTESKGILSLSGVPLYLHRDFRSRPHRLHGEVLNLWPLAIIRERGASPFASRSILSLPPYNLFVLGGLIPRFPLRPKMPAQRDFF